MSPEESVTFLIDVIKSTSATYTPSIRTAAIDGLGYVGGDEVRAFLVGLIKSTNTRYTPAMRAAAAVALGRASQG
jgi:hypothetical protein